MTETFQIDIKHQIKSISNGFFHIGVIPVIIGVLWIWKGIEPDFILVVGLICWTLIWFIPAIILHPTYYLLNKGATLSIDYDKKRLEILNNETRMSMGFEDLATVERIYFSDYRHVEWQQNWFPSPWRNYGLLRIQTKDDHEFFLTSLMIDIVNPPIEPTTNTYKFIPLPPKSLKQKRFEAKEREELQRNRIEHFKRKFEKQSLTELNRKIDSQDLIYEAKTAAVELIKEKDTAANIG